MPTANFAIFYWIPVGLIGVEHYQRAIWCSIWLHKASVYASFSRTVYVVCLTGRLLITSLHIQNIPL